jgi:hypothetical protein
MEAEVKVFITCPLTRLAAQQYLRDSKKVGERLTTWAAWTKVLLRPLRQHRSRGTCSTAGDRGRTGDKADSRHGPILHQPEEMAEWLGNMAEADESTVCTPFLRT